MRRRIGAELGRAGRRGSPDEAGQRRVPRRGLAQPAQARAPAVGLGRAQLVAAVGEQARVVHRVHQQDDVRPARRDELDQVHERVVRRVAGLAGVARVHAEAQTRELRRHAVGPAQVLLHDHALGGRAALERERELGRVELSRRLDVPVRVDPKAHAAGLEVERAAVELLVEAGVLPAQDQHLVGPRARERVRPDRAQQELVQAERERQREDDEREPTHAPSLHGERAVERLVQEIAAVAERARKPTRS